MTGRTTEILERLAEKRAAVERTEQAPDIGRLFDAAVARHRDRLLWVPVDGGPSLTYGQFATEVSRCVAALSGLGIGQGSHVGVMLPSVPALAITWMALAKLGAVMLPVNPHYSAREMNHLLREGDAEWLIAHQAHRDLFERQDEPLALPRDRIVLQGAEAKGYAGEWQALLNAAGTMPALAEPDIDRLMTLQFTSGSTGAPKGCMLPHRYWTTIALVRANQAPPVERMLVDMPFHYMGGQWRFLMALLMGATAYVARQPSLARMLDRLIEHDIQFCSVTSAFAKQPLDPRRSRLRLTWASAMAVRDLQAPLEERLNGAPVLELYGLTETGAAAAMPHEVSWMTGSGSCGLAVPFRTLRVVDGNGRDVRDGEAGELWIGGPGMMQGYYKRDDANREAFRQGWFRSGDLFRRDGDGFMTVIGRLKDVIRRSGENVSAAEVEGVLCAMPEIVEAAAVAVPDEMRGEEIKVCLTLRSGLTPEDLPPTRIIAFCSDRLARFKLPRYIAYLPALPKTPSGKIAKHLLGAREADPRLGSFDMVDGRWR
jgi:acyl-CoA synthetase (AMP-forming)/AMP-acid ligase II